MSRPSLHLPARAFRWLAFALALASASAYAALPTVKTAHVDPSLVANVTAIAPGQPFWTALRLKTDPGWHTYWVNPGDSGEATEITWNLPPGWTAGPIQWPAPHRLPIGQTILNYGYEGDLLLPVLITPPANIQPGSTVTLSANANWLVCAEICLPGAANLSLTLPVQAAPPPADPTWQPVIAQTLAALPQPPAMFNVSAWRQGDQLFLGLEPRPGADLPAEFKDVYFFSLDSQTQPIAPQTWHRAGDGWILTLTRADSAPAQVTSLPGVLVTSGSWIANGTISALALNPPLSSTPPPG
ncbi:MAG: protein-disulfide reductase DsbD domain-containing protein, partial [Opitutales bacterium]